MNISGQTIADFAFDLMYNPYGNVSNETVVFFKDMITKLCNDKDKEFEVYNILAKKYNEVQQNNPSYKDVHYNKKDIFNFIEMLDFLGIIKVSNMILLSTKFDSFIELQECLQDG